MVSQLFVSRAPGPLHGSVPVPGDPALGQIALGVAACAAGTTRLAFPLVPEPVRALALALGVCGVPVTFDQEGCVVAGSGLDAVRAPGQVLDARGAPLAASVLAGLLASRSFESVLLVDDLWADDVLPAFERAHPLERSTAEGGGTAVHLLPVTERSPGVRLRLPGARPWAKVALLLGALRAASATSLQETLMSPDHAERLLHHLRLPVETSGPTVTLHPPRDADALRGFTQPFVGDPAGAAFLLVAAALLPGSHVTVRGVSLNPSRSALLEALRILGARVGITPGADALAEPVGEISIYGERIRGGAVAGELGARLGDDFVPLAVLSAATESPLQLGDLLCGGLVHTGAGTRDVARVVGVLRAFGLEAMPSDDGLVVAPPAGPLRGTEVTTGGDARLALAATVLGLCAEGPTTVDDVDCLGRAFPRWAGTLRALGARVEVRQVEVRQ